ncbi:MAG: anti-sigma regulatory factor [Flavobacterium piscis]|jgi:serine/threonine-protein kinase RsbT|uniref:anti-sigma regulatory factor n=1 Tax=Flavobacterium sp. KBS0721 TaxID=1179672 RepID=UPI00098F926F|nr:anti-sigma regulatory factor [Flavobacterium sp. KBS0721]MCA1919695.1 anti-sigma regulatory factor [Flavobacterium piscis]QDW21644.1 anti-sigma regulatory factor [Flavobacterium sp. KBS0721]
MTTITNSKEEALIVKEQDVVPLRNRVKEYGVKMGMSILNQTKLITATSELVRNLLKYGGGGRVIIESVSNGRDNGVRVTFIDKGPGIADISLAMKDGFSTGKSLGLGLPGTKRLVNEFDIKSELGNGTTVTITKWKNG